MTVARRLVAGAGLAVLLARIAVGTARARWRRQPNQVPALIVLIATWVVFYGYYWLPPELQADGWNMGSALGRLVLLLLVVLAYRGAPMALAALWWCVEDGQVVLCTVLYLLDPMPVAGDGGQCSMRWGVPLELAGLALGGAVAWAIWTAARRATQETQDDPSA